MNEVNRIVRDRCCSCLKATSGPFSICPGLRKLHPGYSLRRGVLGRAGIKTYGSKIMYGILLLLHLLSATVWTGGHIVLAVVVLPRVLEERSPELLLAFESVYEKIGMPALIVQVLTGLLLAYRLVPDIGEWFTMANPVSHPIAAKLILLALTAGFAVNARFRVIPALSKDNLEVMAGHIVAVTVLSVLFVIVGVSFRTGWLY